MSSRCVACDEVLGDSDLSRLWRAEKVYWEGPLNSRAGPPPEPLCLDCLGESEYTRKGGPDDPEFGFLDFDVTDRGESDDDT